MKRISAKDLAKDYAGLVALHMPRAVHDDVDYRNAMEMVDALTRLPDPNQDQLDYLETLGLLVEAYEAARHPIVPADPLDVLKHLMEENDMNVSDLGRLLGERSLGSKILSGERELSKAHIRTLARRFNVGADLFL